MDAGPLVSVIVCAFNAEAFIEETLQTILSQTYQHIELVVVDDGSTDGTAAIVHSFRAVDPRVHYFYQPNAGLSAARNSGLQRCSGELICFFDADDLMPSDRLALQVDFLQQHTDVQMVICDYRNFSEQGQAEQTHFQTCPQLQTQLKGRIDHVLGDACAILANENFGIAGTPLLRRTILEKVPSFDERLRSCEDFHFYFRLARQTKVGIINKVGMLRRIHGNNLTSNWQRMLSNGVLSYSALRDTEASATVRRLLNTQVAVCWQALARQEANHGMILPSLRHYCTAFATDPGLGQFNQTLHGILRTLAIALSLHKPD